MGVLIYGVGYGHFEIHAELVFTTVAGLPGHTWFCGINRSCRAAPSATHTYTMCGSVVFSIGDVPRCCGLRCANLAHARSTEVNVFYHDAINSHGDGYNDAAVHDKVATAATIPDVLPAIQQVKFVGPTTPWMIVHGAVPG